MINIRKLVGIVSLLCLVCSPLSYAEEHRLDDDDGQCQLFIAPSNIPEGGWGMFTAVDIPKGSNVGKPEIVVHVLDMLRHHGPSVRSSTLLSQYDWQDPFFLGHFEADETHSFLPGLGSAVNSHAGHHNIVPVNRPLEVDSCGEDRSHNDPGAGAFTYFHGSLAASIKFIPAGSELYLFDGEEVFQDREEILGVHPLENDFERADSLMKLFTEFSTSMKKDGLSNEALTDLWRILIDTVENDSRTERLAAALPRYRKDIPNALSVGSAEYFTPLVRRSKHWLQTKGYCADNLEIKPSTILHAGRGAFASRFISKGEVISLLPFIHFVDPEFFNLYELKKMKNKVRLIKNTDKIQNKQLLLNYCLKHEKSPLLLLPFSPGSNLINHSSDIPNSFLRWTDQSLEWLIESSFEDLEAITDQSILSMELIASRDIRRGEEVLLNYGTSWENAWKEHVKILNQNRYKERETNNNYEYAWHQNKKNEPFPIDGEDSSIPRNLQIVCLWDFVVEDGDLESHKAEIFEEDGFDVYEFDYEISVPEYAVWTPCRILDREETDLDSKPEGEVTSQENFLYTVILEQDSYFILNDIPHTAIRYMDKPYTSDAWLSTSFRHPIGIPEEMFPDAWKIEY